MLLLLLLLLFQSCPTLCEPLDGSPPGSAVPGILQARILEWAAISFSVASMWDECNCAVVWIFFGIAFLWDWNEVTFSSPVATAEFSKFADILSAALSQHQFRIWNSSTGILSPPLTLFIVMLPKAHLTSRSRMSPCSIFLYVIYTCSYMKNLHMKILNKMECLALRRPRTVLCL